MKFIIPQSRPSIAGKELKAVGAVLKTKQLSAGPETALFEKEFAAVMHCPYAAALNSGTSALHLALLSLGAKKGKEVIIPSYTCTALLNAVNYTGSSAIVADINPDTASISEASVKRNISRRTIAIIAVHNFGMAADIAGLKSFGIPVIEDCAHSLGGKIGVKYTGTLGEAGVYSFYPTKMMTTGEGGMIVTGSREIIRKVRELRDYDGRMRYLVRYNYKMSDIAAAIGMQQLEKLESFIQKRRKIAKIYDSYFKAQNGITVFQRDAGADTFYRYIVLMPNKASADNFIKGTNQKGVICDRPVSKPLHRYIGLSDSLFPVSMHIWARAVSIPIYPSLREEEVNVVIRTADKVIKQ